MEGRISGSESCSCAKTRIGTNRQLYLYRRTIHSSFYNASERHARIRAPNRWRERYLIRRGGTKEQIHPPHEVCGRWRPHVALIDPRNPAIVLGQRTPRHGPFLHHRFPANTRSARRCPDCKSVLQEIHRFPPDYSLRTRYQTGTISLRRHR